MNNTMKLRTLKQFIYSLSSRKLQQQCHYNTTARIFSPKKWKDDLPVVPQKRQPQEKLFPLHDQFDKYLGIYSKKEAEKMAKDLELKLVCVQNSDNPKQQYNKFITGMELHKERLKERELKKDKDIVRDDKLLTISDKITPHDLGTRIKAINKWLKKRHKVQMVIELSAMSKLNVDSILQGLKDGVGEMGKVEVVRRKTTRILLEIIPLEQKSGEESSKETLID